MTWEELPLLVDRPWEKDSNDRIYRPPVPADMERLGSETWPDIDVMPPLCIVDSFGAAIYGGDHAAMTGGMNVLAKLHLTTLHNALVRRGKGVVATINPVYDERTSNPLVFQLILTAASAGSGAVIKGKSRKRDQLHHFSLTDEPGLGVEWSVERDRFQQAEPLCEMLNDLQERN
jgi:hypothetical protein